MVTVCDVAHEELESLGPGTRLLHWSIPDPTPAGTPAAFDDALRSIERRVETLAPHVRLPRSRRSRP